MSGRRWPAAVREFFGGHEFAALVAAGDEGEVVVEPGQLFCKPGTRLGFRLAVGDGLQAGDFGVALQHLEAHADFVDAVVERFQLGRLVDHVFRRRHLAAVMQPGGDVHRFPFLVAELEILVRAAGFGTGGARQHLGQFGNAGAVAAGVGALGVDRPGDQLDEGLEQHFLGLDQLLALERDGDRSGQRLDEAEAGGVRIVAAQQQHGADQIVLAVEQRNGDCIGRFRAFENLSRPRARTSASVSGAARAEPAPRAAPSSGPAACGSMLALQPAAASRPHAAPRPAAGGRRRSGKGCRHRHRPPAAFRSSRRGNRLVEIVFGGDRHADVEKAPDRPLHAVHGHGQVIDFEDQRIDLDRLRELEAADRFRLAGQLAQGSGNAARQSPR